MPTFHLCSTRAKIAPDTSQIRVFPHSLDLLSHLRLYYFTAARTYCNSTTSTMTETDSDLPHTSLYPSRMSPEELRDACEDIWESVRTTKKSLSAPPNSGLQTSEEHNNRCCCTPNLGALRQVYMTPWQRSKQTRDKNTLGTRSGIIIGCSVSQRSGNAGLTKIRLRIWWMWSRG
jgi:hypothetical protein